MIRFAPGREAHGRCGKLMESIAPTADAAPALVETLLSTWLPK